MKSYYLLLVFLVGCGHTPDRGPELIPTPVPVVCEELQKIESIDPLPVIWVIGTDDEGFKVLGLRGSDYSNLSINSQRTLLYIIEQTKYISYYKKCIANHNARVQKEGQP